MLRSALAALASALALLVSLSGIGTTPARAEFNTTTTSNGQVVYRGTNVPAHNPSGRPPRGAPEPQAGNDHDRTYRGGDADVRSDDPRRGYYRSGAAGRGIERPRYDESRYRRGDDRTAYGDRPDDRGDYRPRYDGRRPPYVEDARSRHDRYRPAYDERRPSYADERDDRRDGYRSAYHDRRPAIIDNRDDRRDGYRPAYEERAPAYNENADGRDIGDGSADNDRRLSYEDDSGYRGDSQRPVYSERPYYGGDSYRGYGGYRSAYHGGYGPSHGEPRDYDEALYDNGYSRGYGGEYLTAGYSGVGYGGGYHGGGAYGRGCCGGGGAVVGYSCSVSYIRYGWRSPRVSAC